MANEFTDARSRPGARLSTGTDDRELFLIEFGEMVLEAWAEVNNYEGLTFKKTIVSGKADTFPIIGRKRDAAEHTPGDRVLGGQIEHNDISIVLDKLLYDAAFISEIDQLMANYDLAAPYARQLGESLSTAYDRRVATMHLLASRVVTAPYTGGPLRPTTTPRTWRPTAPSWKRLRSRPSSTSRPTTSAAVTSATCCRGRSTSC